MSTDIKSRHHDNKFLASDIRRRLASRHASGTAVRAALDRLSDEELVAGYLAHKDDRAFVPRQKLGYVSEELRGRAEFCAIQD
jgi:hypothetical protein